MAYFDDLKHQSTPGVCFESKLRGSSFESDTYSKSGDESGFNYQATSY